MIPVDGNFILAIAPRFSGDKKASQTKIIGAIAPIFSATLDSYGISTRLRIAHFMGQVTHECTGFTTTEEFASGVASILHRGSFGDGVIQLQELLIKKGFPLSIDGDFGAGYKTCCHYISESQ